MAPFSGTPLDERTITLPDGEELWLHSLLEVAESISSADGIDRALNRLAWLALKATSADRCGILVPADGDPLQVRPAAGASRTGDLAALWERFQHMDPINVRTDLRRPAIWQSRHATIIEDVATSNLIPQAWKLAWGSKSIAYAPLRASGEIFGILAVEYVTMQHRFAADEIKALEAIASAAGVALRGAALVERLQRSVSVERRLSECSAALLAGLSRDEVLDEIADRFTSLVIADAVTDDRPDQNGGGKGSGMYLSDSSSACSGSMGAREDLAAVLR